MSSAKRGPKILILTALVVELSLTKVQEVFPQPFRRRRQSGNPALTVTHREE
jgi:multisubunit Na+/H+ antiporter MnhC subunit